MSYTKRRQEILQMLQAVAGAIDINTICNKIYASRSTIRRDLIQMEKEGILTRNFGSVNLVKNSYAENAVKYRLLENTDKKSTIAKLSRQFIQDNSVLFLDSSSTVSYLIPYIKQHRNITIITNGIKIAEEFSSCAEITCYICPGKLKPRSYSIIGEYSTSFIQNFQAQFAFFSCKAINNKGLFEGSDSQALFKQKIIEHSDHAILLCDSSKQDAKGYFKLCNLEAIDTLITDSELKPELSEQLHNHDCQIIHS